jgi:ribosome biogenesis GTPase
MTLTYDLGTLGWNSQFETEFEPFKKQGFYPARVALEYQGLYRVYCEAGELLAEVTGRLRYVAEHRADFPSVGDWVAIAPLAGEGRAVIHALLPRTSKFSRKAAGETTEEQIVATNVDTIFLVQGLDQNYNLRRVERYLALAFESGARPVIVLNKMDLCEETGARMEEIEDVASGVPIHAISSKLKLGLEQLDPYLVHGQTVAFLGSSGVGKSTLINRLIGEDRQKTRDVREEDSKGRHTTVHRELIVLHSGGLLIDTPGMRELQLWEADDGLGDTFADIEEIAAHCRFTDCGHQTEPDCAVLRAVQSNELEESRFENYKKMHRELEYLDSRQNVRVQIERKEREKRAHRGYNRIKRKR